MMVQEDQEGEAQARQRLTLAYSLAASPSWLQSSGCHCTQSTRRAQANPMLFLSLFGFLQMVAHMVEYEQQLRQVRRQKGLPSP